MGLLKEICKIKNIKSSIYTSVFWAWDWIRFWPWIADSDPKTYHR